MGAGYRRKVIVSGHVIEVYEYEVPVKLGRAPVEVENKKGKGERERDNWNRSQRRRRQMVRRLVLANFTNRDKFITLTFAENVTDIEVAAGHFTRFIKRLRRRYEGIKYLAVVEFQKRGAVHYHMISDITYVPNAELREIWGQGHVKINRIRHVDNVGAYVVKYMVKDLDDPRLKGKRAYYPSRNLDKPSEYVGEAAEMILEAYALKKKPPVYTSSYESEYNGTVRYAEYNLLRTL